MNQLPSCPCSSSSSSSSQVDKSLHSHGGMVQCCFVPTSTELGNSEPVEKFFLFLCRIYTLTFRPTTIHRKSERAHSGDKRQELRGEVKEAETRDSEFKFQTNNALHFLLFQVLQLLSFNLFLSVERSVSYRHSGGPWSRVAAKSGLIRKQCQSWLRVRLTACWIGFKLLTRERESQVKTRWCSNERR